MSRIRSSARLVVAGSLVVVLGAAAAALSGVGQRSVTAEYAETATATLQPGLCASASVQADVVGRRSPGGALGWIGGSVRPSDVTVEVYRCADRVPTEVALWVRSSWRDSACTFGARSTPTGTLPAEQPEGSSAPTWVRRSDPCGEDGASYDVAGPDPAENGRSRVGAAFGADDVLDFGGLPPHLGARQCFSPTVEVGVDAPAGGRLTNSTTTIALPPACVTA